MSRSKAVRALRKSVCLKLAVYLHTSTKRVDLDVLPYLKQMLSKDAELRVIVAKELSLEPEEMGFLLDKKPDSKEVKAVFLALEGEPEPKPAPAKTKAAAAPKAEPPAPKVQEPEKKPAPEPRKNSQASLFDF